MAVLVELEVADHQHRGRRRALRAGAAHQPTQPGHQLLERERLGHVVVAARGQPRDPVLDRVAGGEEDDRYVGQRGAHPAQHLEAVDVGQHHVEHDGVGALLAGGVHGGAPGVRHLHLPALVAQRHRDQLGDVHLVVDDEDAQRGAVGAGQVGGGSGAHVRQPAPAACAFPVRRLPRDLETSEATHRSRTGRRAMVVRHERHRAHRRAARRPDPRTRARPAAGPAPLRRRTPAAGPRLRAPVGRRGRPGRGGPRWPGRLRHPRRDRRRRPGRPDGPVRAGRRVPGRPRGSGRPGWLPAGSRPAGSRPAGSRPAWVPASWVPVARRRSCRSPRSRPPDPSQDS